VAFRYHPELEAILAARPVMQVDGEPERSWKEVREEAELGLAMLNQVSPAVTGVSTTDDEVERDDGARVGLRWYVRDGTDDTDSTSAVVYLHGGGMICGNIDLYGPLVAGYVSATGVPMLAVNYRVAPESPHPIPVEDCFAGLQWLHDHAQEFAIDPDRIAVMGDSGGGGLAAGVALMARDRGTPLARQVLVYPMLDDRNITPDPELVPFAGWTYESNRIGWSALLGDTMGSDDVSSYAAPAREQNLAGLAPAYVEVGELDIFRDEDIDYARRLAAAGVSVELHVHPGAPHGFDRMAPDSGLVRRAMADRFRVLRAL
jgi:acetyl esterase/lipase